MMGRRAAILLLGLFAFATLTYAAFWAFWQSSEQPWWWNTAHPSINSNEQLADTNLMRDPLQATKRYGVNSTDSAGETVETDAGGKSYDIHSSPRWYMASKSSVEDSNPLCTVHYGQEAIDAWTVNTREVCTSPKDPPLSESIRCHMRQDMNVRENVCEAENVTLNLAMVPLTPSDFNALPQAGTLSANCKRDDEFWNRGNFGYGAAWWLYHAFQTVPTELPCDAWLNHQVK